MQIWFSSDWHLSHANIIKYCGRPFSNEHEMNDCLITLHNERVKESDHFYTLGDVAMRREHLTIVPKFNGHKRLVRGNHDIYKTKDYMNVGFEEIYATRRFDDLIFSHIPIHERSLGRVSANIHGHIHEQENYKPSLSVFKDGRVHSIPYINICVERTNYHPITLEEVRELVRAAKELGTC